jgi:DNA-binding NarL/FixJ family response regulator
MAIEVPETVIVVASRGWSGGTAQPLRELVDKLVAAGTETAVVADAAEAAKALVDDEGAVVIIDVDDAARGLTTPAIAAARVSEIAAAVPDAAPVAVAQRPAVGLVVACLRAGAVDFVDLGSESYETTAEALTYAARKRAKYGAQKRALKQLRAMVEEMLKDLVRTERRSIDLEKQLAQKNPRTAGLASDVDAERDPVIMDITTFAFVTGEEAVAHADLMSTRGQALDLVLIDIGLPGIDGLEVIRRLRKDRPGLAAFLITGYADPNLTARAADLGVAGFVLKPFDDSTTLIERVRGEAMLAMARTRDHGYLQRIKTRHDRVLTQYRLLLADLEK